MPTAEQWEQIQDLFHAALEKEPAERTIFLEKACAGDELLQREVAFLISAHETEDHFIDAPGYVAARDVLATHHFEPGEMLSYYKIEAELGHGGMGEVYLAEDIRLNRKVALKLLPPHYTVNPDRVRRFEREARAASALNHPNIVTIYEIGKSDTTHFIATEFVDGKTLRQLINEKPLTLNETLNVSMQVADALSGAHAAGIVHRDVKPENIMIRRDGYVKILDFGLAKLTEQQANESDLETPTLLQSNPGLVMGTVHYMSPEQARARNVGVGTDIWSLGIVMYELLAGRVPFTGETSSHVMVSLMEDKLPPLKNHANVPDELDRFVTKALRKNQRERYKTAGELARDLKNFKQTLQQDARLKECLKTVPSRKEGVTLPLHKPLTTVSGGSEQEREPPRKKVSFGWIIPVTVGVLALTMVVVLSLNRRSTLWSGTSSQTPHLLTTPDRFIQVTKRDGFISAARFAPDGKQIVYSAGFDGKPVELFLTDVEGSESRSYGIQSAALKSVSRSGKIAVLFDFELNWSDGYNGTLAILPPDGGKPEIIGDGIDDAAFAADGNTLAIIRRGMGEQQLEYPSGQVLHKSEGWMSYPRFSPKGDKIAFFEHPLGDAGGSIIVFDLASGKMINISSDWKFLKGLAWDPNNNEIWFGGGKTTKKQSINAVSLSGELRLNLHEMPGMHARIEDISEDGKVLIAQGSSNHTTMMIVEGNSATKAIDSQFSFSTSADLSADGKTLLYYEGGFESSDPADGNTVYLRKLDSSENIKLGPGKALALSPDGKSALALQTKPQPQLVILSTSGSEPKILPNRGMKEYYYASFFPDGRQILFTGIEALEGAMIRSFVQDVNTGQVQPLTEEGTTALRVSPDGKRVITLQPDQNFYIQGLDGGEPKEISGLERDDEPIQWSDDGRAVFVKAAGDFVTKIYRVDLATGQRREWRDIDPPNKVGHVGLEVNPGGILITPDGKVCIYTYWILLQQMFSTSIS